jgi:hypothetical protein
METVEAGILHSDEGSGAEGAVQAEQGSDSGEQAEPSSTTRANESTPSTVGGEDVPQLTAEELQRLPPELRPGPDGKPPKITEKLLRQMRGHYFTVKHVKLEQCGHRLDMVNEPRHNCENCWWQWFLHHPQLVETTDQFYRTQGKGPLIAMRGKKYATMFFRFMSTYIKMAKEEAALKAAQLLSEKANESAG